MGYLFHFQRDGARSPERGDDSSDDEDDDQMGEDMFPPRLMARRRSIVSGSLLRRKPLEGLSHVYSCPCRERYYTPW